MFLVVAMQIMLSWWAIVILDYLKLLFKVAKTNNEKHGGV